MSRKLIFFGNERLISGLASTDAPVLRSLIDAGYDIKAVVANDAGTKSRTKKPLEVAEVARAHNIPVHLPERPMDIYDLLASYDADAGILVAYGRIVPQKLIDLFPFGIINIHPSLLPKYRGPSPIESAILNGDDVTGVSIMALLKEMDAGPVYAQVEYLLDSVVSAPELAQSLTTIAASKLIDILPQIFSGALRATPQDNTAATYCQLIQKSDALIDPSIDTTEGALRKVRAYLAFPRARILINGQQVIILRAHLATEQHSILDVRCKEGILAIDELIAPSGKTMTASAYLAGIKT